MTRRLAIYAHYDPGGAVRGYVTHMLAALRPLCERIVFSSTAALTDAAIATARAASDEVRQIPNFGADVAMYRDALGAVNAADYDELLLVNSSTIGPVGDLGSLMDRMSADPCDFWGMTDGTEMGWNLQGYFLVYKQKVCRSKAFVDFWRRAEPLADKREIIRRYEHGLTAHMTAAGFKAGCVVSVKSLGMQGQNVTFTAPERLLELGMPLVKIAALRALDLGVVRRLRARMSASGFDLGLVDEVVPRSWENWRSAGLVKKIDDYWRSSPEEMLWRKEMATLVTERATGCSSLCEVGSGSGLVASALRDAGWAGGYVGYDTSSHMLELAKASFPRERFEHGDAYSLRVPDRAFDVVVCLEVLRHLPDADAPITELCRVANRLVVFSLLISEAGEAVGSEAFDGVGFVLASRPPERVRRQIEQRNDVISVTVTYADTGTVHVGGVASRNAVFVVAKRPASATGTDDDQP